MILLLRDYSVKLLLMMNLSTINLWCTTIFFSPTGDENSKLTKFKLRINKKLPVFVTEGIRLQSNQSLYVQQLSSSLQQQP
jgi:hypothetical protein